MTTPNSEEENNRQLRYRLWGVQYRLLDAHMAGVKLPAGAVDYAVHCALWLFAGPENAARDVYTFCQNEHWIVFDVPWAPEVPQRQSEAREQLLKVGLVGEPFEAIDLAHSPEQQLALVGHQHPVLQRAVKDNAANRVQFFAGGTIKPTEGQSQTSSLLVTADGSTSRSQSEAGDGGGYSGEVELAEKYKADKEKEELFAAEILRQTYNEARQSNYQEVKKDPDDLEVDVTMISRLHMQIVKAEREQWRALHQSGSYATQEDSEAVFEMLRKAIESKKKYEETARKKMILLLDWGYLTLPETLLTEFSQRFAGELSDAKYKEIWLVDRHSRKGRCLFRAPER